MDVPSGVGGNVMSEEGVPLSVCIRVELLEADPLAEFLNVRCVPGARY